MDVKEKIKLIAALAKVLKSYDHMTPISEEFELRKLCCQTLLILIDDIKKF